VPSAPAVLDCNPPFFGAFIPVAPKKACGFLSQRDFFHFRKRRVSQWLPLPFPRPRVDIYTRVTDRIVEQLEQGIRPWMQPWNAEHAAGRITRPLRHNGEPYKGINILQLWASAEIAGYACPIWMTFQQAKELGGHVKKGEHGSPVVYASTFKRKDQAEDGEATEEEIPFLKEYTVFNVEQCEGLPAHFYALSEPPKETIERIEHAERFFANTGAKIEYGGNRAFYAITTDSIRMPSLRDVPRLGIARGDRSP
jgi:antirestriction protein ArdC